MKTLSFNHPKWGTTVLPEKPTELAKKTLFSQNLSTIKHLQPSLKPLPPYTVWRSGSVGFKNQQMLEGMHAVFNLPAESNTPWFTTIIYKIGKIDPIIPANYLEAVATIKNAKNLYIGDLHGSWLKLLLKLAQFECIQMPEVQAKEFLSIHRGFETLIEQDKQRVLAKNANKIAIHEAGLKANAEHDEKEISKQVEAYKQTLISFQNFTSLETKQETHQLVGRFKKALSKVEWVGGNKMLHLLGDVLLERGQLDLFTLLLVEKFKAHINVVLSNHDFGIVQLLMGHLLNQQAFTKYTAFPLELIPHVSSANRLLCSPQVIEAPHGRLLGGISEINDPAFSEPETLSLYRSYMSRLKFADYNPTNNTVMFHSNIQHGTYQRLVRYLLPNTPLLEDLHQNPNNIFQDLTAQFQAIIHPELHNPTNRMGHERFQGLLNFLHDEVWENSLNGRATDFDYAQRVKNPNIEHYMVGHHPYSGGYAVPTENAIVYQLDNRALHFAKLGEQSPVVIS